LLRINKSEINLIEKVMKDSLNGVALIDSQVKFGGRALKKISKDSNSYIIDEGLYHHYLARLKYFVEMKEYEGGEWARVDGLGNIIKESEYKYLDKCIKKNSEK